MVKKKDKELMMDMLRHPAELFYHDNFISVLRPTNIESLKYHSNLSIVEALAKDDSRVFYVVKTYKKETFCIYKETSSWFSPYSAFKLVSPSGRRSHEYLEERIKKYPSLYKAFEKEARQISFLPLIKDKTDDDIYTAVKKDPRNIVHVKNLSLKQKKYILEHFPDCFRYMKQTTADIKSALRQGKISLDDVQTGLRSNAICELALKKSPSNILYVPYPTEKQKLSAVRRDGRLLSHISNPSFEVMVAAVRSHPDAWECIKDEKLRKKLKKAK